MNIDGLRSDDADRLERTLAYYSANAEEFANKVDALDMSAHYALVEPLLPADSLVLDLGCGSGRDARHFAGAGHRVVGLDPCPEMLAEARRRTPAALAKRIHYVVGSAPGLPFRRPFCSAIWAYASLLHLPRQAMPRALADCFGALLAGGAIAMVVKRGDGDEFLRDGRWFTFWRPGELRSAVADAGFEISLSDEVPFQDGQDLVWVRVVGRKP
jgi:SAM-dependent methyltransferase